MCWCESWSRRNRCFKSLRRLFSHFLISIFFIYAYVTTACYAQPDSLWDETLTPYHNNHGSRLNYRTIRECQPKEFGDVPHEDFPAQPVDSTSNSFVETRHFKKAVNRTLGQFWIKGHYSIVYNPLKTLSVLEPNQRGGCSLNIRQTVAESSKQKQCKVAVNAGFFDTHSGACLGNVVSDGYKAKDSGGIQNAHFGIKNNGNIFVGYVSEEELHSGSGDFLQLVGGVVWILRNSMPFVNASKFLECEDTEETGTMDTFVNVLSARTVVGHDKMGRVIILQIDGQTYSEGVALWELETLLQEFGFVNAINLDGGGSATYVVNGTLANYPSDECPDKIFRCSRKVSTILCVHDPYCDPANCSGHGQCHSGKCICDKNWQPPHCDYILCGTNNCSQNGHCAEDGCVCNIGWTGDNCSQRCPDNWYGFRCEQPCLCINNSTCDSTTGQCKCQPGFRGQFCELECPFGFFGQDCLERCFCEHSCSCNSISGACDTIQNSTTSLVAHCLAKQIIEKSHLIKDDPQQRWIWIGILIASVSFAVLSIIANVIFLCCFCSCSCKTKRIFCLKQRKIRNRRSNAYGGTDELNTDMSSEDEIMPMNRIDYKT